MAVVLTFLSGGTGQAQTITTVVGGNTDHMPATATELGQVPGIPGFAADAEGNLYIADRDNDRIRKVDRLTAEITTVVGTGVEGFSGDGGPATEARLFAPTSVAVRPDGVLYIADAGNGRIRKVSGGIITTLTGEREVGAPFVPVFMAVTDKALYVALAIVHDAHLGFLCTYQIDLTTGAVQAVVICPTTGSTIMAEGLAADFSGNLYIATAGAIYRREADGVTEAIVGSECPGADPQGARPLGDNGPASKACTTPRGLAVDSLGTTLYIADNLYYPNFQGSRVRKVDLTDPQLTITTVAGGGTQQTGGLATEASLGPLWGGIAIDAFGTIYFGEAYNVLPPCPPVCVGFNRQYVRIRKVTLDTGLIFTAAGGGIGDGFPATKASLDSPRDVRVDADGNLYIFDSGHNRIRRVDAASGLISTVAGGGIEFFDGVPALKTFFPDEFTADLMALDSQRSIYVSEVGSVDQRVRQIEAATGLVRTVAGDPRRYQAFLGFSGDGGPATLARFRYPSSLAVDGRRRLSIADSGNRRIRQVDLMTGLISTVAGTGEGCFAITDPCGNGGPATEANISYPGSLATDSIGTLYLSETCFFCQPYPQPQTIFSKIRKVDTIGTITTVASFPQATIPSLALDGSGDLYLNLWSWSVYFVPSARIYKITPSSGLLSLVAGHGSCGFGGDGGPATQATFCYPGGLAVDANGNLFIADTSNHRIRMVTTAAAVGPPVVATVTPAQGPVGTSVVITGSNFGATQGTSSVTFSGVTAMVTSWSNTSIQATVPPSAITGSVVVTVKSVPSNSNVIFRVQDFALTASPIIVALPRGMSGTALFSLTLMAIEGFNTPVGLSVTAGLPSGANATFNPSSVTPTGTSSLTLTMPGNLPGGSYPMVITATAGALSRTVIITAVVLTDNLTTAAIAPPSRIVLPRTNDHSFLTSQFTQRDQYLAGPGAITLQIPITRVVVGQGGVSPDFQTPGNPNTGQLFNPFGVVVAGTLSAAATLTLPAFDVDSDIPIQTGGSVLPERPQVYVNPGRLGPSDPGCFVGILTGRNQTWRLNTFQVPIQCLRFPALPAVGGTPTPALNTIRIVLDSQPFWAMAVDWAALSFKALSPIVIIPARDQSPGFFSGLVNSYSPIVPIDATIDNTDPLFLKGTILSFNDSIEVNGARLNDCAFLKFPPDLIPFLSYPPSCIPDIARRFGVDSLHFVAHSKGGLDAREYLAKYSRGSGISVLSLTTLSTPHQGTVLADLVIAAKQLSFDQIWASTGPPRDARWAAWVVWFQPYPSTRDLTTYAVRDFNRQNYPALPPGIFYKTVTANADTNGTGVLDCPQEGQSMRRSAPCGSRSDKTLRAFHETLRGFSSVTIGRVKVGEHKCNPHIYISWDRQATDWDICEEYDWRLISEPTLTPQENDIAVTVNSALDGPIFTNLANFVGKDHFSVADAEAAQVIFKEIRRIERLVGDFR